MSKCDIFQTWKFNKDNWNNNTSVKYFDTNSLIFPSTKRKQVWMLWYCSSVYHKMHQNVSVWNRQNLRKNCLCINCAMCLWPVGQQSTDTVESTLAANFRVVIGGLNSWNSSEQRTERNIALTKPGKQTWVELLWGARRWGDKWNRKHTDPTEYLDLNLRCCTDPPDPFRVPTHRDHHFRNWMPPNWPQSVPRKFSFESLSLFLDWGILSDQGLLKIPPRSLDYCNPECVCVCVSDWATHCASLGQQTKGESLMLYRK